MTLDQQIQCAKRELERRERVYPLAVRDMKMRQSHADYQITCMAEIVETLTALKHGNQPRFSAMPMPRRDTWGKD